MRNVIFIILGLVSSAGNLFPQASGGGGGGGMLMPGNDFPGLAEPLDAVIAQSIADTPVTSGTRLDRLKALGFDRKPSAILAVWAPAVAASIETSKKSTDPIDIELEAFQRSVTQGDWVAVKKYLAGLEKEEAKAGYHQLLTSLGGGAPVPGIPVPGPGVPVESSGMMMSGMPPPPIVPVPGVPGAPVPLPIQESNRVGLQDFMGLLAAAPQPLDRESIPLAGGVLRQALTGGLLIETLVTGLERETQGPSPTVVTPRQAAQLIAAAEENTHLAPFLPPADEAARTKDTEALNLRARYHLALHAKKAKQEDLDRAWELTQLALRTEGPPEERADSLRRAVDLAHRMEPAVGKAWIGRCFRDDPALGKEILAAIGTWITQGLQKEFRRPEVRRHVLEVQKAAVDALIEASPQRADEWRDVLTLLAQGWAREAVVTCQLAQGSGALSMHQDQYGNIYYTNASGEMGQAPPEPTPEQPAPIPATDLLTTRPDGAWLERVLEEGRPGLTMTLCKLFLKAEDEDRAIPCIAEVAKTMPARARELADEFLDVWIKTHDLNPQQGVNNPFMMMWGYNERANGIPLTRTKQERNLADLAEFTRRMHEVGIGPLDEDRLARAFKVSHSSAEVYRSDAVEKVFGPIAGLRPKTLAGLAQQMRENLAGLWRKTEPQQEKKTNRKLKDIETEVLRGYEVAQDIVQKASEKFPDDHHLVLARAALLHDENGYRQELAASKDFAKKNEEAFSLFEKAAQLYAKRVPGLPAEEQSSQLYEQWFYASLGACDPGQIDDKKQPDLRQPDRIREAIMALPGEAAGRHLDRFATGLFTRLTGVGPAVKFRYLEGGFRIVGDRKQASDARRVFEYYRDLVTEIKLETVIDGPADVGHAHPFGVFVRLRHTTDIEREAGGFAKYLTNANTTYSWSFQSNTDYRERFQTAVKEKLEPHFEILSITFETDKVHSRAAPEYGWRITPYAYLLLRPRGPQIDRVPPLRLDLDFVDTSGTVILPIESPAVPLDAKAKKGAPRPFQKVEITQTLDDRQAAEDKVQVEIKATALGLVPELEALLALDPGDFTVARIDDQGVSVTRFHPESERIAVESERTWVVSLKARPGMDRRKRNFRHGKPRDTASKVVYQRYDDADLVTTGAEVVIERVPVDHGRRWRRAGAATAMMIFALLLIRALRRRRREVAVAERWPLPRTLSPFTTIGMLERFMTEITWSDSEREELRRAIMSLEDHYFSTRGEGAKGVDLKQVLEEWLRRVRSRG